MALAAVALVALAIGGAFAFGLLGGQTSTLEQVPVEADVVAQVNPGIVDDARSRALFDAAAAAAGFDSFDDERLLSTVESRTGLHAEEVERVVAFGRYDGTGRLDSEYGAAIVHANWSIDEILSTVTAVTDARYTGGGERIEETNIYRPQYTDGDRAVPGPTVAVLDEGQYAIGTELAVEDAVAVANGNADSVGGTLQSTFESTEKGLLTVAARVPSKQFASLSDRMQDLTRVGSIRAAAVTYDTNAERIVLRSRLRTNGTGAARDLTALTSGGLPIAASWIDNQTAAAMVASIELERDGRDVTLSLDASIDELRNVVAYYDLSSYVDRALSADLTPDAGRAASGQGDA